MQTVAVPGRVNLIGEHIDYHGLPVLPMAIRRRVTVRYRSREDRRIVVSSAGYGTRAFEYSELLGSAAFGDWENYIRAAARIVNPVFGIDAQVDSDLPAAAGLSSSSALLVSLTLALFRANGQDPGFEELMRILPDGEQFVGTRGGGMDHAAVLASHAGCASLIAFDPVTVKPIPIPRDWSFLVAHSLTTAEKSGAAREAYNARRTAGSTALERLGFSSYRAAMAACAQPDGLEGAERDAFLHVTSEALRVKAAVSALQSGDGQRFGDLLLSSHASLRDRLHVSSTALDQLVDEAMEAGALGARLTGAGFGGCVVVLCQRHHAHEVRAGLIAHYYRGRPEFEETRHLMDAEPGPGVLCQEEHATPHD